MSRSIFKLRALVVVTVLSGSAWLVASGCIGHGDGGPFPYSPYKISIDSVEPRGQLNVEEKEGLFLLNKGDELILEIPKFEEFGPGGLTIVGNADRVLDQTRPLHERMSIDHAIKLKTDNPDIRLCRSVIINENTPTKECKNEITTNLPIIGVRPQGLEDLAKSAGVLDQEVAETLLSFELDGKIDDLQFLVKGRVIYDNTEEARLAYEEKLKSGLNLKGIISRMYVIVKLDRRAPV